MNNKRIRFNENIKILRNQHNLTQEELAYMVSVVRQTVSKWEQNSASPDLNTLVRLAEVFHCSIDELVLGKNIECRQCSYCDMRSYNEVNTCYIRTIDDVGYYDIIDDDLAEFYPAMRFEFSKIMGIAVELKKLSFQIATLYQNGFGVYISSKEEATDFVNQLSNILDNYMHCEKNTTAVKHSEKAEYLLDEVMSMIMQSTLKKIYGFEVAGAYFWIDGQYRIRGYGRTEEECKQVAERQGCEEYLVVKDKK